MVAVSLGTEFNNEELLHQYRLTGSLELRQQLIVRNIPLVKYTVGKMAGYLPSILSFDDLVGHATIGLIEAIEHFDPTRGSNSFIPYAVLRLRGSVMDAIRKYGYYPRGMASKRRLLDDAVDTLTGELGDFPTDEQIAERLGMSASTYRKKRDAATLVLLSLDSELSSHDDDNDCSLLDTLQDDKVSDPIRGMEETEMQVALFKAFKRLSTRERTVIALYYFEGLTQKRIGQLLGISESRVSHLRLKALMKLRRTLVQENLIGKA
ncbi:MAG: sigma-70 family RNA polymerase sigma factor [Chloroflexi bacterium]|nr:sigma-70 family RNA polymerase sigma factor [Chloroflexota bacterium]